MRGGITTTAGQGDYLADAALAFGCMCSPGQNPASLTEAMMGIENSEAGLPAITAQAASHDRSLSGDDTGEGEKGFEPAMVVLPSVDPQRMPELAFPGLPPVDPAEPHNGGRSSRRPADTRSPSWPAVAVWRGHPAPGRKFRIGTGTAACVSRGILARNLDPSHKDRRDNRSLPPGASHKDRRDNRELRPCRSRKDWEANPCPKYLINNIFLSCESRLAVARRWGRERREPGRPPSRTPVIA